MKSNTRIIAEKIAAKENIALIRVMWHAHQYVNAGLCQDIAEALEYMLELQEPKQKIKMTVRQ